MRNKAGKKCLSHTYELLFVYYLHANYAGKAANTCYGVCLWLKSDCAELMYSDRNMRYGERNTERDC